MSNCSVPHGSSCSCNAAHCGVLRVKMKSRLPLVYEFVPKDMRSTHLLKCGLMGFSSNSSANSYNSTKENKLAPD